MRECMCVNCFHELNIIKSKVDCMIFAFNKTANMYTNKQRCAEANKTAKDKDRKKQRKRNREK